MLILNMHDICHTYSQSCILCWIVTCETCRHPNLPVYLDLKHYVKTCNNNINMLGHGLLVT